MGGTRHSAGPVDRVAQYRRQSGPHTSPVSVSAGRQIQGHRQHRRRREFRLPCAVADSALLEFSVRQVIGVERTLLAARKTSRECVAATENSATLPVSCGSGLKNGGGRLRQAVRPQDAGRARSLNLRRPLRPHRPSPPAHEALSFKNHEGVAARRVDATPSMDALEDCCCCRIAACKLLTTHEKNLEVAIRTNYFASDA